MLSSKKQQLSILFEPGGYFHSDFAPDRYQELPTILKKIANHDMITHYQLTPPHCTDLLLPVSLLNSWYSLSQAALLLGVFISDVEKIVVESPWIITHEDYVFISQLCQYDRINLNVTYHASYSITDYIALGAAQLRTFISLFSAAFSHRFVFIFSKKVNNLIAKYSMDSLIIPGNFIEKVCIYAENKHQ